MKARVYAVGLAMAVLLTGCSSAPWNSEFWNGVSPTADLRSNEWKLESIGDQAVLASVRSSIDFSDEGLASGSGGCDRWSGNVKVTGSSMVITNVRSTQMACAGPTMAQQQKYYAALQKVTAYVIDGSGKLRLLGDTGASLLVFGK